MNHAVEIRDLKQLIIRVASEAQEGHIASAFSILDILWVLYDKILKYDHRDPMWNQRDRFILSKGHASLGLYAVLAAKGFFTISDLRHFARFDGFLGGHPDCNKVPGVEASTGSLGHGLPMAVGMALGLRVKKSKSCVFCLIGDGEANEGSIWEAVMLAAHHNLSNMTCIVDFNHSTDRALNLGDLRNKFAAFGWESREVDGHDPSALAIVFSASPKSKPTAIIADTIKGKGCPDMENNPSWHHRAPKRDELQLILDQIT